MADPSGENENNDDRNNRSTSKSGAYGNLFEIIDMIVFELNRTKRMFIVMILSVMIIPPVALFLTSVVFVPPFEREVGPGGRSVPPGESPQRAAGGAPHTLNEYFDRLFSTRNVPLMISIIWLGFGIRQWFILSKWTKRYEEYKRRRDEVDRQLDESLRRKDSSNQE
jgi:hypothetical protein